MSSLSRSVLPASLPGARDEDEGLRARRRARGQCEACGMWMLRDPLGLVCEGFDEYLDDVSGNVIAGSCGHKHRQPVASPLALGPRGDEDRPVRRIWNFNYHVECRHPRDVACTPACHRARVSVATYFARRIVGLAAPQPPGAAFRLEPLTDASRRRQKTVDGRRRVLRKAVTEAKGELMKVRARYSEGLASDAALRAATQRLAAEQEDLRSMQPMLGAAVQRGQLPALDSYAVELLQATLRAAGLNASNIEAVRRIWGLDLQRAGAVDDQKSRKKQRVKAALSDED